MKACPATMTLAVRSRFSPRIARSRAFSRPVVGLEQVVGTGLRVVEGRRHQLVEHTQVDPVPVGRDLHR